MEIAAKLDDYGKPAWIAVMVAGFIVFWPLGLAVLGYMIWSGRLGCSKRGGMGAMGKARGRWYGACGSRWKASQSTGNSAFDEYREETLRRLEDEQQEFMDFLDRLRQAKDKSEFDQFMADRRSRRQGPTPNGAPGPQDA